jgi:hypothetical protein
VSNSVLVSSLAGWVRQALTLGREHCIDVRRHVRIPGAGRVDLLTVRHEADRFGVGLWTITDREGGDGDIDAMTRRIHAFEAWYSELLERAEFQGFSPGHRIFVSGNIVAPTVRRTPLVDLLSTRGSSITFWTWGRSAAGFEVAPFYGKCPALASPRTQIKDLLPHLPWEDRTATERTPSKKPIST